MDEDRDRSAAFSVYRSAESNLGARRARGDGRSLEGRPAVPSQIYRDVAAGQSAVFQGGPRRTGSSDKHIWIDMQVASPAAAGRKNSQLAAAHFERNKIQTTSRDRTPVTNGALHLVGYITQPRILVL